VGLLPCPRGAVTTCPGVHLPCPGRTFTMSLNNFIPCHMINLPYL
jgi:hypothetical protein